ncbi:hypothetical protein DFH94DRAFT_687302 [Russula ochroleuca]|uniref:Uncharacterized protein n=1 Tax=Russula ochroleuca TaxID=152965 RepID=A0A9P5TDL1_9AGAM|nr:hypothetical protein DFH94DRAFT_687302 [Russula ochroleuca]
MASLDVPRPSDGASLPPSSRSRMAHSDHSRQMSSLSMTTFTTTSQSQHYPSEPLLHGPERTEPPSRHHVHHPDPASQAKDYWERSNARRVRRWGLFQGVLLSILGSWACYTTVRYFIAYGIYRSNARRSAALPLGISSSLSLLFVIALAVSFVLPYLRCPQSRSQSISLHHALLFLLSFFLIAPAVVNLVLVCVWRHVGSDLSLRGRCHWDVDAVWGGVGGQCVPHAPAWGVWLTAAILRLALTVTALVVYHIGSRRYRVCRWPPSYRPEDVRKVDPVEIPQMVQGDAPNRPSPVLHSFVHRSSDFPQRSLSSRMAAIPELSDAPNQENNEQENAGPDSSGSSTLSGEESNHRSAESGATPPKSLRRTKSSRDAHAASSSSRHAALVSNVGEGELQGFAEQFRALVDQVSRELEEARNLEYNSEINRDSRTPPLHHVLDTHTPYMSIDEFGREVPSEESIAVLGGVIKRMPTIESVGSREFASLRSATLLNGNGGAGMGSASIATSSSAASSRPPTGATIASFNDAASVSQPSSRSNSIHRLRTPSELGELVRDALRARGQSRPLPGARPGSGGSLSGSGSGAAESVGPPPRSRSNSLGPNEVLPPVTEHGELGREDPPPLPPRRRDVPEQLLVGASAGGNGNAGEMGELLRAEWTRSWTSSSPSATSTYITAGTSGSLVGGGGGSSGGGGGGGSGGGEIGTGGSGGPQVTPRK